MYVYLILNLISLKKTNINSLTLFYPVTRVATDNNIRVVEYGAFLKQENSLQVIELQRNKLEYFPTLTTLNRLRTIDLSSNNIESIGYLEFNKTTVSSV